MFWVEVCALRILKSTLGNYNIRPGSIITTFFLVEFFRIKDALYLTTGILWHRIETTLDEFILLLNFILEQNVSEYCWQMTIDREKCLNVSWQFCITLTI